MSENNPNIAENNGEHILPTYEEAIIDVCAVQPAGSIDFNESESTETRSAVTTEQSEEVSHAKSKKSKKKKKTKRVILLICDPQCDFLSGGSMSIPGCLADATRLSEMIRVHTEDIAEIYVSLNSRHKTHITNPSCWRTESGVKPLPMTVITQTDILLGKYRSRLPDHQERFLEYVTALELSGKDDLILWPDHCLIGTEGHAVIPPINDALQEWAGHNMTTIDYITKGSNCFTEMYSAMAAEVPQADDLSTSMDSGMIKHLSSADRLIVAGQSLSHVVNQTVRDLLKEWPKSKINRIYVAKDCCSPFPGFERQAEGFLRDMQEIGINLGNASDALYFKTQEELDAEAAALAREKAAIAAKTAALKFAEEQRAAAAAAQAAALKAAAEAKEAARQAARQAELRAIEEAKAAKIQTALAAAAVAKRLSDLEAERLQREKEASAAAAEEVRQVEAEAAIAEEVKNHTSETANVEETSGRPEVVASEEEEARLQSEASAEAEAATQIGVMRARIQTAEITAIQLLFNNLAQETTCDTALTELVPRMLSASNDIRALAIESISSPAESLVSCLTSAVVRCNEEFSVERESRVRGICDLLLMLLECDGWTQVDEKPSSSVHMSALKARQQAVLDAGGSDALVAVLSLGIQASDEMYALAARVVDRMCRATDLRSTSSGSPSSSPSRKSTKIKTAVCVAAQELFIPHAKTLAALLKIHGSRRESSAVTSLCSAIIHIAQENPSAQRRFLDMQTVTVIHDMLKSFPADYSEFSDVPLIEGDTSQRQLIISQKLYMIQALRLVVDPTHRRSKSVNGKVQTLLESIRDNLEEDVSIKEIAQDILTLFASAVQSDDGGSTKTGDMDP